MNSPESTLYTQLLKYFNAHEDEISRERIEQFAEAWAKNMSANEIKMVVEYACDALHVEFIESEITPAPHAGVIVSDEMKSYLK